MTPVFRITQLFFDREAVVRAVGKATAPALKRGGGFVRTWAKRLMKSRKKGSSLPGQAPYAHPQHGARIRKLLFFSYDPATKSVVIGPVALPNRSTVGATVPNVHEFGGRVVRRVKRAKSISGRVATPAQKAAFIRGIKSGAIVRTAARQVVTYPAKYSPRPYMGPSLNEGIRQGKILAAWGGAVRGVG